MTPTALRQAMVEAMARELALLSCHPSKLTKFMVASQYRRAEAVLSALIPVLAENGYEELACALSPAPEGR